MPSSCSPLSLSNLAKKYEYQPDNKKEDQLELNYLSSSLSLLNNDQASSSIDKLLDSFFSKNFDEKPSVQTNNQTENKTPIKNRTKSISFSVATTSTTPFNQNAEDVSFSLSDLANEFLATNKSQSDLAESSEPPLASSLIDLIDYEFNKKLSVSGTISDSYDNFFESTSYDSNADKLVDLCRDGLLIHNSSNLNKNLISGSETQMLSTSVSSTTSQSSSMHSSKEIKFIIHKSQPASLNLFEIENKSKDFGDFLSSQNQNCLKNITNQIFEDKFSYSNQINMSLSGKSNRKKLNIDLNEDESSFKTPNSAKVSSNKKKKSSSNDTPKRKLASSSNKDSNSMTGVKKYIQSSSTNNMTNSIKIFDFSIPSPDDIVIAKQRFAFKNMRFK